MASTKNFFIVLATIAVFCPCISAEKFIVGDDKGWALNFDGEAWVQGKEFHVGDELVFNYEEGKHNVLRVDGNGFRSCSAPASTVALTTGSDVIPLASAGRKWYICGVSNHCENANMKLLITVLPATVPPSAAPSPNPNQNSSPTGTSPLISASMVLIFGILMKLVI